MKIKGKTELKAGDIITLSWARKYPRQDAPLFILLEIPYDEPLRTSQMALAYCYYDPTDNGWTGLTWTLSTDQLMPFKTF